MCQFNSQTPEVYEYNPGAGTVRLSAKLTSEGWFLDSGLVPKNAFYHMVLVWFFSILETNKNCH